MYLKFVNLSFSRLFFCCLGLCWRIDRVFGWRILNLLLGGNWGFFNLSWWLLHLCWFWVLDLFGRLFFLRSWWLLRRSWWISLLSFWLYLFYRWSFLHRCFTSNLRLLRDCFALAGSGEHRDVLPPYSNIIALPVCLQLYCDLATPFSNQRNVWPDPRETLRE